MCVCMTSWVGYTKRKEKKWVATRAAAAGSSSVGAVPSGGGHAAEVVTPVAAVAGVGAAEDHRHADRESAEETRQHTQGMCSRTA